MYYNIFYILFYYIYLCLYINVNILINMITINFHTQLHILRFNNLFMKILIKCNKKSIKTAKNIIMYICVNKYLGLCICVHMLVNLILWCGVRGMRVS